MGAVYLIAAFIAAASPTPGGLGAIEAALIAGLTGIGADARHVILRADCGLPERRAGLPALAGRTLGA